MTAKIQSRGSSPDELFQGDYDFNNHALQMPLIKQNNYSSQLQEENLFDLGIMQQHVLPSGPGTNLQYINSQQDMLPQVKEGSLDLDDYVQRLNDRFDLPHDQLLPMTPCHSFDQGNRHKTRISYFSICVLIRCVLETPLRTDNTLI